MISRDETLMWKAYKESLISENFEGEEDPNALKNVDAYQLNELIKEVYPDYTDYNDMILKRAIIYQDLTEFALNGATIERVQKRLDSYANKLHIIKVTKRLAGDHFDRETAEKDFYKH
jgi:hypothetical protein